MVSAASTKKDIPRQQCDCGAMIAQSGRIMHERSKAHQTWAAERVVSPVPDSPTEADTGTAALDSRLASLLEAATRGEDPRWIAKQVRVVFAENDWPDSDHLEDVGTFLRQHDIPVLNLPRHVDPDRANRYVAGWQAVLKSSGWGKPGWDKGSFERNWNVALAAEADAAAGAGG
jgi:hypothetical protein